MSKTTYTIHPLHVGTIRRKKENMSYGCGDQTPTNFPLIVWYLAGGGRNLLVDTGGSAPDGVHWMPYEREADQRPDLVLRKLGVAPEEISGILLTHLHWDHAGNNQRFPNAERFVQRLEYETLVRAGEAGLPGFERELALHGHYTLLEGDCAPLPGIRCYLTPGHTAGSQCIEVSTAQGPYLLGGDLITLFENWTAVPHIPNGGYYDLDVMRTSLDKVEALGCTVLPGHDFKVFEHSVYPI